LNTPRLTLLLLLGAATAGCSTEPATPAGSATAAPPAAAAEAARLTACDLLTSAEVTGVIGEAVLAPEPNGFECAFRRPAEGVGGVVTRAVRLRLEQGAVSPYDLYDQYTTAIRAALDGEYDPQPVAGVGSVAGWDGDALLVAEGAGVGQSVVLVVHLDGVGPDDQQRYAEAIAQAALARLRTLQP
jgi:hypothetical protein